MRQRIIELLNCDYGSMFVNHHTTVNLKGLPYVAVMCGGSVLRCVELHEAICLGRRNIRICLQLLAMRETPTTDNVTIYSARSTSPSPGSTPLVCQVANPKMRLYVYAYEFTRSKNPAVPNTPICHGNNSIW